MVGGRERESTCPYFLLMNIFVNWNRERDNITPHKLQVAKDICVVKIIFFGVLRSVNVMIVLDFGFILKFYLMFNKELLVSYTQEMPLSRWTLHINMWSYYGVYFFLKILGTTKITWRLLVVI